MKGRKSSALMQRADRLLVGVALVLPWLFIWQGLDVTDQGYMLTIYRSFLRHPDAVAHTSHMWLTNVIGGTWDALFGGLGVLSQRVLWALSYSGGLWLVFRAIGVCCGARAAALGILVASAFLASRRETWFSYNTLTALLSAAGAVMVFHGTRQRSLRALLLAGFLLGLSPFARLSNVLHAAILSAPLFAVLLDRSRLAGLPRELLAALLGYTAAVALAFTLMLALGHWPYYWQAVHDLLHPSAPSVGHSVSGIGEFWLRDHLVAVPAGLVVGALGVALFKLAPRLPRPVVLAVYALLLVYGAYLLTRQGHTTIHEPWSWLLIGSCYVVLGAFAAGVLGRSAETRLACFIGLVALLVTPIGSDNGIRAAHLGVMFALPVVIAVLYSTVREGAASGSVRELALLFASVVLVESADRGLRYTYRDEPKPKLSASMAHPQLRGLLTSPARAKVMTEVLPALEERTEPGDFVLAYDGTPLLQYLTFTRPYAGRPWLMTDDDPALIPSMLNNALKKHGCLPVTVTSRRSARSFDWPTSRRGPDRKQAATRKAIVKFLKRHGYRTTWRNDFFEILEPEARGGAPRPCRKSGGASAARHAPELAASRENG